MTLECSAELLAGDTDVDELFDLMGKVAIVTGSSQGIGLACAERLCQHGARVVFSSRNIDDCRARASEANAQWGTGRAIAVVCDVSDPAQVRDLVARTADHWGRLDVVVGSAAHEQAGTSWVERVDPERMSQLLVDNITSNLVLAQEAVPIIRRQGEGSIVFVGSTAGVAALEDYLPYGVAKAGLIHMARVLAVQLGPLDIRVNCVSPGAIASRGFEVGEWSDDEFTRVVTGPMPLGRPGVPDEIASCVVWLASPGGAFATGQNFVIDGGQTLKGMEGPHAMFEIARARKRADDATG